MTKWIFPLDPQRRAFVVSAFAIQASCLEELRKNQNASNLEIYSLFPKFLFDVDSSKSVSSCRIRFCLLNAYFSRMAPKHRRSIQNFSSMFKIRHVIFLDKATISGSRSIRKVRAVRFERERRQRFWWCCFFNQLPITKENLRMGCVELFLSIVIYNKSMWSCNLTTQQSDLRFGYYCCWEYHK
jgi:hypothetical protein